MTRAHLARCCTAIAAVGLFAAPATAQSLISPWIENPVNGHRYALFQSWSVILSEMQAIRLGGHLATIRNADEQAFVRSTFGTYGGQQRLLWIGLTDSAVEGQYRWMSGEPVTYTNWAANEPNGAQAGEDYVALYYPNHSQGGRWNDWADRKTDPIGLPFNGVVEVGPEPYVPAFLLETDSSWKAIAPVGNQQGQPTGTIGSEWEFPNRGWNNSLTYDDSAWAPATKGEEGIWSSGEDTPTYFRKTFELAAKPDSLTMLLGVDDDVRLYINGVLVINDTNQRNDAFGPIDIAQYVHAGTNLIAAKAHDAVSIQSFSMMLYTDSVPEPTTLTAGLLASIGLVRRRR